MLDCSTVTKGVAKHSSCFSNLSADVFFYQVVSYLPFKDNESVALTNKYVRKRMQQINFVELANKSFYEKLVFLRKQLLALLGVASQEFLLDQVDLIKGLLKEFPSSSKLEDLNQASAVKKLLQNFNLWNFPTLRHYARTILLIWQLKHSYFSTGKQRDRALWELQMNIFLLAYLDPHFYPYLFKNTHVFVQGSQTPQAYVEEFSIVTTCRLKYSLANMAVKWVYFNLNQKITVIGRLYKQAIKKGECHPTILEKLITFVASYHSFTENLSIIRFFLQQETKDKFHRLFFKKAIPISLVRVLAILTARCSPQVIHELSQKEQNQLKQIFSESLKEILTSKDSSDPSQILTCAYILSGLKVLAPRLINLSAQQCSQAWDLLLELLIKETKIEQATWIIKAMVTVWPILVGKQQILDRLLGSVTNPVFLVQARVAHLLLALWKADSENTAKISDELVSIWYAFLTAISSISFSDLKYTEVVRKFTAKLDTSRMILLIKQCLAALASDSTIMPGRALMVLSAIASQLNWDISQFSRLSDLLLQKINASLEQLAQESVLKRVGLAVEVLLASALKLTHAGEPLFMRIYTLNNDFDHLLLTTSSHKLYHCNSAQADKIVTTLLTLLRHLAVKWETRTYRDICMYILGNLALYGTKLAPEKLNFLKKELSASCHVISSDVALEELKESLDVLNQMLTDGATAPCSIKTMVDSFPIPINSSFRSRENLWLLVDLGSQLTDKQLRKVVGVLSVDFEGIPIQEWLLSFLPLKKEALACLELPCQELTKKRLFRLDSFYSLGKRIKNKPPLPTQEVEHCSSDSKPTTFP